MNFVSGEQVWMVTSQQHQRSGWLLSPDGKMVAVGNGLRQVDFLDVLDGHILFTVILPPGAFGRRMAWRERLRLPSCADVPHALTPRPRELLLSDSRSTPTVAHANR